MSRFAWRGRQHGYVPKPPPRYWRRWGEFHRCRPTVDDARFKIRVTDIRMLTKRPELAARRQYPWSKWEPSTETGVVTEYVQIERDQHTPPERTHTFGKAVPFSLRLCRDEWRGRLLPVVATVFATRESWIAPGCVRWFLVCPRCQKFREALYSLVAAGEPDPLACRVCLGLKYPSQRMTKKQRLQRRAKAAAEHRLWARMGLASYPRPKGMHRKTHAKLVALVQAGHRSYRRKRRKPHVSEDTHAAA